MILIGYLNQGNPFPIGPWVFEITPVTIPNGSREGITTKAGSSSGDVNGSLIPDPKRNEILLENLYVDFASNNSEPFNFNLITGQELKIKGMHLSFLVPGNLEIIDYETLIPEANIYLSDDRINVTWIDETLEGFELGNGAPLFVIHAKAKDISRPGDRYSIVLDDRSHFIDQNGDVILGARLSLPVISLVSSNEAKQTAYPNPFVKQVTFNYNLPEENQAVVMVIDLSGRLVLEINDSNTQAGMHQVKADCSSLKPGLYQYIIKTSGNNQVIANGTIIKSN
jgi:hypothetical protein